MSKRLLLVGILVLALATLVAGCVPSVDKAKESAAIQEMLTAWEGALEAYDVAGMMAPIASEGFSLTIKENGAPQAPKDRATLEDELNANKADQARMREEGYKIDIKFANVTPTVESASSASVTATFTTNENIENVPGTLIHENGTLDGKLIKENDKWVFQTMTLNFNPIAAQ